MVCYGLSLWPVFHVMWKSLQSIAVTLRTVSSLMITYLNQGETADTLAALRLSKELGYLTSLAVCNVAGFAAGVNLNLL
ncbi:hypothetical protein J4727_16495 [Providencia rettgeri]|uniref:Uncharacterized protein n=1 Tax=Providencia rettgeri TaxID=587 RepID=A0A939NBW7_PRORE|nr:hypothetical protein [Providencia rettgeri]